MPSIRIENLSKSFGRTVALKGISLLIEPGELFFLLGPSGCGKTTLLRCLAGFQQPDEGRIFFGGEDVTGRAAHRRNTGMVFQNYALWPHMTVAENVAFGLEERHVDKAAIRRRVGEALEAVRMGEQAGRRPNQLSGGQQQRVALARALVVRPDCLLLDEPLSNLDARLRQELRVEIRRVCRESGLTTVYVTHDQKEALSISDRMAVMESGRILQVGAPAEVYRRPADRTVAGFIGETNFVAGRLISVSGAGASVRTDFGTLEGTLGARAAGLCAGDAVTLSIRPECWRLESSASGTNSVRGRIGQATYLGELAQYDFEGEAGVLKVFELNPRFVGDGGRSELFASAAPSDVVILPAD
jgi:iron(III) transport system ATP-binding protein